MRKLLLCLSLIGLTGCPKPKLKPESWTYILYFSDDTRIEWFYTRASFELDEKNGPCEQIATLQDVQQSPSHGAMSGTVTGQFIRGICTPRATAVDLELKVRNPQRNDVYRLSSDTGFSDETSQRITGRFTSEGAGNGRFIAFRTEQPFLGAGLVSDYVLRNPMRIEPGLRGTCNEVYTSMGDDPLWASNLSQPFDVLDDEAAPTPHSLVQKSSFHDAMVPGLSSHRPFTVLLSTVEPNLVTDLAGPLYDAPLLQRDWMLEYSSHERRGKVTLKREYPLQEYTDSYDFGVLVDTFGTASTPWARAADIRIVPGDATGIDMLLRCLSANVAYDLRFSLRGKDGQAVPPGIVFDSAPASALRAGSGTTFARVSRTLSVGRDVPLGRYELMLVVNGRSVGASSDIEREQRIVVNVVDEAATSSSSGGTGGSLTAGTLSTKNASAVALVRTSTGRLVAAIEERVHEATEGSPSWRRSAIRFVNEGQQWITAEEDSPLSEDSFVTTPVLSADGSGQVWVLRQVGTGAMANLRLDRLNVDGTLTTVDENAAGFADYFTGIAMAVDNSGGVLLGWVADGQASVRLYDSVASSWGAARSIGSNGYPIREVTILGGQARVIGFIQHVSSSRASDQKAFVWSWDATPTGPEELKLEIPTSDATTIKHLALGTDEDSWIAAYIAITPSNSGAPNTRIRTQRHDASVDNSAEPITTLVDGSEHDTLSVSGGDSPVIAYRNAQRQLALWRDGSLVTLSPADVGGLVDHAVATSTSGDNWVLSSHRSDQYTGNGQSTVSYSTALRKF